MNLTRLSPGPHMTLAAASWPQAQSYALFLAGEAWERMHFGGLKIPGRVLCVLPPACRYEPMAFTDEWTYQWHFIVDAA